jgi:hypothetical protein
MRPNVAGLGIHDATVLPAVAVAQLGSTAVGAHHPTSRHRWLPLQSAAVRNCHLLDDSPCIGAQRSLESSVGTTSVRAASAKRFQELLPSLGRPRRWRSGRLLGAAPARSGPDGEPPLEHVCRLRTAAQIRLLAADPDAEVARLEDPSPAFVGKGHLFRREICLDP